MFKKLLLVGLIVLGLVYGSGYDFASLKRAITSASNENARAVMSKSNDGWGPDSGY
ncbi:hypothetical protein [Erythrobacter mangrovi]|uniref:Uncharacterized protein n=1 Tax=Erythrobacter mangrovi TaxID=2739433 RepID=A0A7D3XIX8_9SPHN|nr:hypothetical protein [Erythrobacter mangrovi]QKG72258.1 hypothetical protein HQR01_13275 [Erythrobacter mangrovi]